MPPRRFEVGLVSADRALVDFYAEVFELDALPSILSGVGVVHCLQLRAAVLKVMVPNVGPTPTPRAEPFFSMSGLRYLTIGVDDLDLVIAGAIARGARLEHGPIEFGAGARIAVLSDPDGNAIEVVQDE